MLYPAVGGKGIDGATTVTSFGTDFAITGYATLKYYYTDIKGSKPIKDPRIGSHFGSQRHTFRSLQLLEQETATHGNDVFSVDGREWIRASWKPDGAQIMSMANDAKGTYISWDANSANAFIEVTGYFSEANWLQHAEGESGAEARKFKWSIDGGSDSSDIGAMTAGDVLGGRYVNASSVYAMGVGATLGIHTLKVKAVNSFSAYWFGIELITQDKFTDATCDYNNDPTITHDANTLILAGMFVSGTGIPAGATVASVTSTTVFELSASTTTGSVTNGTLTFSTENIQIPSQNVVSYGKKFTVSGTPHYDPFNGFTNSTTLHSAVVDTATSLGLSSAPGSSASWAISGSNNIRPYNGGRVVKWVDSSGVVKTSVNMMPPNAQNISGGVAGTTEVTTPSATNATYTPIFSDDAVDHSLAEVAKTFHIREFGNGAANGGTESTYADASMLGYGTGQQDDIAYVMDDGLTSLSGDTVVMATSTGIDLFPQAASKFWYFTFIGTGITIMNTLDAAGTHTIAQNLPYGTHILRCERDASADANPNYKIDGISFNTTLGNYGEVSEITIHQPKMPPIPEDAVVISDYMLMADYVKSTAGAGERTSKGVRLVAASRDCFFDSTVSFSQINHADADVWFPFGMTTSTSSNPTVGLSKIKLPSFGTQMEWGGYGERGDLFVDGVDTDHTPTLGTHPSDTGYTSLLTQDTASTLGVHIFESRNSGTNNHNTTRLGIVSPIHTSSHYQTFETPYLHELVGGDRNMEQTNLVVTPDGKTWDQVTRDVSYIGPSTNLTLMRDGGHVNNAWWIWDWARGTSSSKSAVMKNFALGYNRVIFLEDGEYELVINLYNNEDLANMYLLENTTSISEANGFRIRFRAGSDATQCYTYKFVKKRGDWIVFWVTDVSTNHWHASNLDRNQLQITKIG